MKITAISDLHGHLPNIEKTDVLCIAGDICPHFPKDNVGDRYDVDGQARWLGTTFREWLDKVPAKNVVATYGNHDWVGLRGGDKIPILRWHMLVDKEVVIDGMKFYGTPHQPSFFNWAYNLSESELKEKWRWIPSNTDVIVFHGPPRGYGDFSNYPPPNGEHTGSPSQLERILQIKPKLAVFGHIHAGRGTWKIDNTIMANVSILDDNYHMVYQPMVFEI